MVGLVAGCSPAQGSKAVCPCRANRGCYSSDDRGTDSSLCRWFDAKAAGARLGPGLRRGRGRGLPLTQPLLAWSPVLPPQMPTDPRPISTFPGEGRGPVSVMDLRRARPGPASTVGGSGERLGPGVRRGRWPGAALEHPPTANNRLPPRRPGPAARTSKNRASPANFSLPRVTPAPLARVSGRKEFGDHD